MIRRFAVLFFGLALLGYLFTPRASAQNQGGCYFIPQLNQCFVISTTNFYDNFQADAIGTAPPGWSTATFNGAATPSPAPFAIASTAAGRVFGETAGAHNDIAYIKTYGSFNSIWETFSFTYVNATSLPAPCLVYTTGHAGGGPIQCLRLDTSGNATSSAGTTSLLYYAGGAQATTYTQLRTRPYYYVVGHTYRLIFIVDPTTQVISGYIGDTTLPGQTAFDQFSKNAIASNLSFYPGWENLGTSGTVSINDFGFAPFSQQPLRAETPARAFDYLNFQMIDQDTTTFSSPTPGASPINASQAVQAFLPPTGILHRRMSDVDEIGTQNALASYGIDANLLTNIGDSAATVYNYCNSLTNGCFNIEGPNEPSAAQSLATQASNMAAAIAASDFTITPKHLLCSSFINGPTPMQTMQPYYSAVSNPCIWNTHNYADGEPENQGYGSSNSGCGLNPFTDFCGFYGAFTWNDNMSATVYPFTFGANTEGGGSYGSYPNICGSNTYGYLPAGGGSRPDMSGQMAYLLRGLAHNFKQGHVVDGIYKLLDDGSCTDGFGDFGLVNKFSNNDGTPQGYSVKPAYVALVYSNAIIKDTGATAKTFSPQPLTYGISGYNPSTEKLLLAESDGSYRLLLWSDTKDSPWNFAGPYGDVAPVTVNVGVNFSAPVLAIPYTVNQTTGVYSAGTQQNGASIVVPVNEFLSIVDIIPTGSSATPAPVPTGSAAPPTPGPTETPTAAPPTPLPTSTSLLYQEAYDTDAVGTAPPNWGLNAANAQWAVTPLANTNTQPNALVDTNTAAGDYAYALASYSSSSVEFQFSFLPSSTTTAGVSAIFKAGGASGLNAIVNLSTGSVNYGTNSGGYTGLGTVAGSLGSYASTSTVYDARIKLVNGNQYQLEVWQNGQTPPGYGATFTAGQTLSIPYTAGVRNSTSGSINVDDFAVCYNAGCTLPAIPNSQASVVTLVQTSSICAPTSQTSACGPVLAATPVPGDLLIACAGIDSGTTIPSPPAGWNQISSYSISGAIALYEFWKIAGVGESTQPVFNASATDWFSAVVSEFSGNSTTTPFSNVAINGYLPIQVGSAITLTNTPYVAGTRPFSCNVANSAMGVTSITVGSIETYSAYPSSQSGNGFVPPYNATEGQLASPQPTSAPTPFTTSVTWNLTSSGPDGIMGMDFIVPAMQTSPTFLGFVSSGVTANGFNANCGITNFGGYGCVPVTTTGATINGGPIAVGKYFQIFGSINTPNVTATVVNVSSSPFPNSPTAPPTAAPTTTPTPGTCATTPPLTNGQEYAANFTPYSCTQSPWNVPVYSAGTPTYASWSGTVIANQFGGGMTQPLISYWPGASDAAHNLYYSTPSDPLINVTGGCAYGCDHDNGGVPSQIHVPAGMRWPGSNTDNHVIIIYQSGGAGIGPFEEYDFYNFNYSPQGSGTGGNWQTGDTMSVGTADNCGNWEQGTGWLTNGPGVAAANQCSQGGIMRATELENGYFNHALVLIVGCGGSPGGSQSQYPSQTISGTNQCTDGANYGPPLSARLYYDNSCNATGGPVTAANFPNGLPGSGYTGPELAILCALNQHGAFFTDTRPSDGTDKARGMFFQASGGRMFYAYGNIPGPYAALTNSPTNWGTATPPPGAGILGNRYFFPNSGAAWTPSGFTPAYVESHFHYLDPCESHIPRTC